MRRVREDCGGSEDLVQVSS